LEFGQEVHRDFASFDGLGYAAAGWLVVFDVRYGLGDRLPTQRTFPVNVGAVRNSVSYIKRLMPVPFEELLRITVGEVPTFQLIKSFVLNIL
jgi:hypothetical protein